MVVFKTTKHYVLLLCTIAVITHIQWFNPLSVLTHSDWSYWPHSALLQLSKGWGSWLSYEGLGSPNIQIPFLGFNLIWSLLSHLGFSYDDITKITFLIPISLLGVLSPFFLGLKLFNDKNIAFATSMVYSSSTYFLLRQTAHEPIALVYAIAPLVLLALIDAIDKNKLKQWLIFYLLLLITVVYELRIFLLVLFISFLYLFTINDLKVLKKNIIPLAAGGVIFLSLNLFWLLPTAFGDISSTINSVANRGLFGNQLFDLEHAFSLSESAWTGSNPNEFFVSQVVKLYLWIIPVSAFAVILKINKYRTHERRIIIIFLILSLIGILLTKQSSPPITQLYRYLYQTVPGFNLYREASKFYLFTALSYAVLIGYSLKSYTINKSDQLHKQIYILIYAAVIVVSCVNLYPLASMSIRTMFINRTVPSEYVLLNNFIGHDENNYYRTLWIPVPSRWGEYNLQRPKVSFNKLLTGEWAIYADNINTTKYNPTITSITDSLNTPALQSLIDNSSIKYLILPLRDNLNEDDFFVNYSDNTEEYLSLLKAQPWLKRINIGTRNIAIFENTRFKAYFTTSEQLNQIDAREGIEPYYNFQKDGLKIDGLNFVRSNDTSIGDKTEAPLRKISDISTGLSVKNTETGQLRINRRLPIGTLNTLYTNTAPVSYSYKITGNNINFTVDNSSALEVNDKVIGVKAATNIISSSILAADSNYFLAQGNSLYKINIFNTGVRTISSNGKALNLYKSPAGINLVKNGSFENGLWRPTVDDCNKYDSKAHISMARSQKLQADGRYSLVLAADKHTACTSSDAIDVIGGQTYGLAYKFQVKDGQRAGYDLVFNDAKNTVLHSDQNKDPGRWYGLNTKFMVPTDATSVRVRLKGYPDDKNKHHAQTLYDEVAIQPLTITAAISDETIPHYIKSPIASNIVRASIINNGFTYKNLVVNPSLENGLWQKKVGDCNAYDNKPVLSMLLDGHNKTEGKLSLELNATRHVACTGPASVTVQEGKSYMFSFDYQSPNAPEANYYVSFNDAAGTTISEHLPILDHNWHSFTKSLVVPFGATNVSLSVYSFSDEFGGVKVINRYDNFSLIQIPAIQNRYYTVSTTPNTLQQPKNIDFQLDSPTKKRVQVKSAATPFYLDMSESYHPQWRLELSDSKVGDGLASLFQSASPTAVAPQEHFIYNGSLNSWYVEPAKLCAKPSTACKHNADGSYDLKLVAEFTPQRYFYVGLIISGTTLAASLAYLGYTYAIPRLKNRAGYGRSKRK